MENGDDADDGGDELMSPTSEADSDSDSDDDSQEHDMPSPGNKRDDCPYDPERPETWPDSQWKAPDWLLPDAPPYSPSPEPSAPEPSAPPTDPVSEKERLQQFWKKFVVKRPNGGESMEETKEENDHVDSETLQLDSQSSHSEPAYSDPESDHSSVKSEVSEAEFTAAMSEDTTRDMRGVYALASSSSTTLHTPDCVKPEWWGYPEVDTPPKVSVARLSSKLK